MNGYDAGHAASVATIQESLRRFTEKLAAMRAAGISRHDSGELEAVSECRGSPDRAPHQSPRFRRA